MISTYSAAMANCAKYRDHEGFCTRNCSCSSLSMGGTLMQHEAAKAEAAEAGFDHYQLLTGKCGDRYTVRVVNGVML